MHGSNRIPCFLSQQTSSVPELQENHDASIAALETLAREDAERAAARHAREWLRRRACARRSCWRS